jgi:hypothetical protein
MTECRKLPCRSTFLFLIVLLSSALPAQAGDGTTLTRVASADSSATNLSIQIFQKFPRVDLSLCLPGKPQAAQTIKSSAFIVEDHALAPGAYSMRFEATGFRTQVHALTAISGYEHLVEIRMEKLFRKDALQKSILLPGEGHRYLEKRGKGRVLTTLHGIALVGSGISQILLMEYLDNYESARAAYASNQRHELMKDLYNDRVVAFNRLKAAQYARNTLITLGSLNYLYSLVDTCLGSRYLGSSEVPTLNISISPFQLNLQVSL